MFDKIQDFNFFNKKLYPLYAVLFVVLIIVLFHYKIVEILTDIWWFQSLQLESVYYTIFQSKLFMGLCCFVPFV